MHDAAHRDRSDLMTLSISAPYEALEDLFTKGKLKQALEFLTVFTLSIVNDPAALGQVFSSPTLDDFCQRIGATSLATTKKNRGDGMEPSHTAEVIILATELHALGGHSRVVEDLVRTRPDHKHLILLTNAYNSPAQFDTARYTRLGATLHVADSSNLHEKLRWVQAHLSQHPNAEVLVFNHHADAVAIAAIQPGLNREVVFHHHCDHQLSLGASLSWPRHFDYVDVLTQRCRSAGLTPEILPLSVPRQSPRAHTQESFMRGGGIKTCSSGTANKFLAPALYPYWEVLPLILKASGGEHIHIGAITPDLQAQIDASLTEHGIDLCRFIYIPWVESLWQAMIELGVDLYIGSFPLGGGRATVEALGAGIPIVTHQNALLPILGACGLGPRNTWSWSTPSQLEKILQSVTPAELASRSVQAHQHYHSVHAPEVFAAIVRGEMHLEVGSAPSSFQDDVTSYLLRSRIRAESHEEIVSTMSSPQPSDYERWLKAGHINTEHPLFSRAQKPDPDLFITVAITTQGHTEQLEKTLVSLKTQLRAADETRVVAHCAELVASLNNRQDCWTLLLCEGDVLTNDALLLLVQAIAGKDNDQALVAYFEHDEIHSDGQPANPNFKPDFNPELLLSYPYMGRALVVRTDWAKPLLEQAGDVFDLVCAYRLMLKALRDAGPTGFVHVPAVLAHLTSEVPAAFVQTSETWQELAQVLQTHLELTAPGAHLREGPGPGTFHVAYPLERTPLVSIVIPTRDQLPFLSRCIDSLFSNTDYPAFEILIVDNDSQAPEAREFLAGLVALGTDQIRVLSAPGPFNFSRMNNLAVAQARGELILLLNNDTAALQADWLGHMVRHALRDDVGIVGARLLYPDGKVQHAGVIMGLRGPAEHPCLGLENTEPGYLFRAQVTQNFSAVTAACLLVSKAVYEEVGGLDETTFGVSYNDIDFCLRVGQTGRRIVWTPLATLLHEGSASQKAGIENKSQAQKVQRFTQEQQAMYLRWPAVIANDPAYNPNLSLVEGGYEIETNPLLCFDKFQGLVEHRIVAFAADNYGCGHYRVLQPLQAMLDAGLCTGGASPEIFSPNLALRSGADTLIFQRPNSEAMLANLQALMPLKGIKKIYEVDDHLARVPIKSAHYDQMPKDLRGKMLKAIGLCDRLVVSTEPLARELGGYNDDVRVVHNRIPPAMWGAVPPQRSASATRAVGRKPKVGWAGGISHLGDLEMIAGVIKDLAETVDWVFFGMCPDNIRPYVKEFHTGIPTLEYPTRLMELAQDWDLAIAPVESSAFNDCKSNLKLLEYGWCGVPVVCSNVLPYQGDLPATRVKNRYKDWREAILERVTDLQASRQEGLALQQRIARDWMLTGDNLQGWYKAWTD